jgi:hypothetical protein
MFRRAALALVVGASLGACANLDERGNSVLGGAIGGAAGAAVGYEAGGRDGAVLGAGAGAATGTAVAQRRSDAQGVVVVEDHGHHPAGHSAVRVPPGHMPPPGKCRVWFPDRPPGQQPPPGDCGELRYRLPPGAVLVRG